MDDRSSSITRIFVPSITIQIGAAIPRADGADREAIVLEQVAKAHHNHIHSSFALQGNTCQRTRKFSRHVVVANAGVNPQLRSRNPRFRVGVQCQRPCARGDEDDTLTAFHIRLVKER